MSTITYNHSKMLQSTWGLTLSLGWRMEGAWDGQICADVLSEQVCTWSFNLPHTSHMGSWEHMIDIARRITWGQRPLLPLSVDPDSPLPLSPSMLPRYKSRVQAPPGGFTTGNLYTKQWRLANQFWPFELLLPFREGKRGLCLSETIKLEIWFCSETSGLSATAGPWPKLRLHSQGRTAMSIKLKSRPRFRLVFYLHIF